MGSPPGNKLILAPAHGRRRSPFTRRCARETGLFTGPRSSNLAETSTGVATTTLSATTLVAIAGLAASARGRRHLRHRVEEEGIVETVREHVEPERALEGGDDEVETPTRKVRAVSLSTE